ncbi:MAG TPA: 2-dehydro-3-deoxygalactonokinase [Paracoccaceae bacterium]|nr:2-dehydro-3-deoxygalactonokinase [Paracoccaceae bacterium]
MPSPDQTPASVIVDWGTTSFRADLVTATGKVLGHVETAQGISALGGQGFEAVLMGALAPWLAAHGALPVVALGMVTSRNGWVEVPYVPCPAGIADLARGTVRRALPNGSALILLAGLTDPARTPFPDVMRGEETQIAGNGLDRDATVVLPGTHSKWAQVRGGRIAGFQTFVTGEVFALLTTHSFIARSAVAPPAPDMAAFRGGLVEAERAPAMLSILFSARTGMLAGALRAAEVGDYVSGLVIGQEFRQARDGGWFAPGDTVDIVGNDGLNARYAIAAQVFGLGVRNGGEQAAIRGALAVLAAAPRQ